MQDMERYFPTMRRKRLRQGASTSQDNADGDEPPRARLRGAAGRAAPRTSSSSVEIVDVTTLADDRPQNAEPVCVVDLTDDNDATTENGLAVVNVRNPGQEDVVDLTNVSDNTGERALARRRRRRLRPRSRASLPRGVICILSDDSDEDIMVLPEVDLGESHRRRREEETNALATPKRTRHNSNSSPNKRSISCPICMESESTIRNNGHQLMSTNCGHVFCRPCIRASINTQHRCPTCRKKLTIRQIHPIFL